MQITLESLTKTYPRNRNPALSIAGRIELGPGTTHGVLGHSGSGKSTLLNLLSLLDRPDENEGASMAFLPGRGDGGLGWSAGDGGTEVGGRRGDRWRLDHFSFVFQAGYLLQNLSVLDNVLMPLRLRGAVRRSDRDRAKAKLEELGLGEPYWKVLPRHLSGGEYQRVAVVRAIVHGPEVVFADEPTGSLDPKMGRQVMEALQSWRRERPERNLLVLVTHNPNHVVNYCDQVTVLRAGRPILHGPIRDFSADDIGDAMSGEE